MPSFFERIAQQLPKRDAYAEAHEGAAQLRTMVLNWAHDAKPGFRAIDFADEFGYHVLDVENTLSELGYVASPTGRWYGDLGQRFEDWFATVEQSRSYTLDEILFAIYGDEGVMSARRLKNRLTKLLVAKGWIANSANRWLNPSRYQPARRGPRTETDAPCEAKVLFGCTAAQRARWRQAAKTAGKSLSAWLREAADRSLDDRTSFSDD